MVGVGDGEKGNKNNSAAWWNYRDSSQLQQRPNLCQAPGMKGRGWKVFKIFFGKDGGDQLETSKYAMGPWEPLPRRGYPLSRPKRRTTTKNHGILAQRIWKMGRKS